LIVTTVFESLSSGIGLDAFRLLVKKGSEGMVAGEIAKTLEISPTNLFFHLKATAQAILNHIGQGRFQPYSAGSPRMTSKSPTRRACRC
jgi:ArsR family transcriptional regulator